MDENPAGGPDGSSPSSPSFNRPAPTTTAPAAAGQTPAAGASGAGAAGAAETAAEVAVVALPDADKGEKLVAVTNEKRLTLDQIREVIRGHGLTNLCAPRELHVLNAIPKLGTGKRITG